MEVEYTEGLIIYEKAEHAVIEGDGFITEYAVIEGDHLTTEHTVIEGDHLTTEHAVIEGDHLTTEHAMIEGDHLTTEHAVIEGDHLTIRCEFQSKFKVKSTTWLLNGKDLDINSKDDKYTSSLDKNSSSLTIHNLKSKDAGTYECALTNIVRLNNTFIDRPVNFIAGLHRRLNCVKVIQYLPACRENKRVTIKVHCKYLFNYLMYPFIFICNLPYKVMWHMTTGNIA